MPRFRAKNRDVEMREQSQKNEMAAALKGDFQRLRARGIETTLGTEPPSSFDSEPAASLSVAKPSSVVAAMETDIAQHPAEAPTVEPGSPRMSFLRRLLSRS